ncbi:MAG: hypothetical protein JNN28_10685 [Saprospiraceae bacterium]|nr:hypothetical protein [Saprospiraceae bacterium]
MRKVIAFIVFCSFWASLSAQDTCVYLFSIPQKADFATADHLGNTYLIRGFELEKYDSTGHLTSRYSTNRLGVPTYVDVFNPMKLMVWYSSFQTMVFLDRNLTELGKVNLAQAGFPALKGLSVSADGNLWAYDELSSQLIKLNHSGIKILESQPLNLEFARSLSPTCIRDQDGQGPWMSEPSIGVLVFDPYLRNTSVISAKNLQSFVIQDDRAIFLESGDIRIEPVRGFMSRKITLPPEITDGAKRYWMALGKLLVLTESGVGVYEVK